ncbi:AMP-binding protein [Sporomusa acidovorans]|uniref:Bifunctional protein Aas n=1 Tax=Sporomusa acidovorans (strain ATCC 49682 / DSM 3132 / Mol) TaxID=1123286 RepID=A0ABZ3IY37_SPOA4|nr:AMP-binding protein [Sporomusa acidovorans]OZC15825.1 bifunctional protein Aas [Sporomusa acidovorans DSM 3132]SDF30138.1 acyl-[acyl-carrier-protein]-phospholipid O-acyltransferase / long-chain-fatty-acid--[acyl-carrier-protein] ligase [Sporomusa acidovorans]
MASKGGIMKIVLRLILQLLYRTKLIGEAKFQYSCPAIILPNHVSFLDAIFLYAYLPEDAYFVVNTAIAAKIQFVLRWVNHIVVDPLNPYSLKKLVGVIKKGKTVVIFPEGRLTTTGNLMKVYSGVAFIALKTGAALHPVIFRGLEFSPLSRLKGKVKSRWFPKVHIYIGKPVVLPAAAATSFRLQKKEYSDRILALLQQAKFQARQQAEPGANLFDKLLAAGRLHGHNKIIAEDVTGRLNYRQLTIAGYIFGGRLKPVLVGEDNVGVMLPNSLGHLVCLFALFYLGKTPAILNFSAGTENNLTCSETAGIKTIITSRTFIEKGKLQNLAASLAARFRLIYLEDIKEKVGAGDKLTGLYQFLTGKKALGTASVILFTSGSESKPKGVVLRHANIIANIYQISSVIDYTHRDKMLNALPMFHSFGLTAGTLLPVIDGVEVFLYPTPLHYKVIPELAYDRNVTLLLGTPTFLNGYAKKAHPYDFYSLRYVLAGGEKLKEEVRQVWLEKFGIRIFEGYGTTETAPVLSLNTPLFNRAGTVGRFLPGIEWRIEDVPGIEQGGNLFVHGPNVMAGYLLHGRGFVPASDWYDCGDVVSIDRDGFISIRSRLKRFAKISGEMVSLDAVEKAAEQCFGTDRNAAINLPDVKKGEKIILYTMFKGASKQSMREFMSQTRQSMLAMPAEIIVIDKLPLLGSGKTDYVTLKALAVQEDEKDA